MNKIFYRSFITTIVMFTLLGLIYPLLVYWVGQLFFPIQANGSLIYQKNILVGSRLIGQNFSSPKYFHGRPSAVNYDGAHSGASDLAPTNKTLLNRMNLTIKEILKENPGIKKSDIPLDLITASGSGLDPHISPESALLQMKRISKVRKIDLKKLKKLIQIQTHQPLFDMMGSPYVSVLDLNLALDAMVL